MPILEVHGLVKYYGRRKVVNGVSFQVDAGEVVGHAVYSGGVSADVVAGDHVLPGGDPDVDPRGIT